MNETMKTQKKTTILIVYFNNNEVKWYNGDSYINSSAQNKQLLEENDIMGYQTLRHWQPLPIVITYDIYVVYIFRHYTKLNII